MVAILSIFLLSLEVDGRKSLLQKENREDYSKLVKQSTLLDGDFHGEMVANHQMKKIPTDLEDPVDQEGESSEGENGLEEGIPAGDEGENGRGTPGEESGEVPEGDGGEPGEYVPGDDDGESGEGVEGDDGGESGEEDTGNNGEDSGEMEPGDNQEKSRGNDGDGDIVSDDEDKRGWQRKQW